MEIADRPWPGGKRPAVIDPDVKAVVEGNRRLAVDLYHRLSGGKGNLFFSPYSISTALAMTYAGARGETAAQMAAALHFSLAPERLHPAFGSLQALEAPGVQLSVANALWPHVDCAFLEAYLELMRATYEVEISAVDYGQPEAARRRINAWVEDKTAAKIKDLIPQGVIDELTRLVLTNAIYFKGDWASPFDAARTEEAPFWVTADRAVQTPLMAHKAEFGYRAGEGWQALELPYAGRALSMVALLPQEVEGLAPGSDRGLAELEAGLTAEKLAAWTEGLWRMEVEVFLPRFRITSGFSLKKALAALGMVDAFGPKADFSGMDGTRSLYVSEALHKAFVEVNEEGTEAAAATAVLMARMSMPMAPPIFRADHPFLFLIRDNRSGSVLFLGRVVNPAAGGG